MGGCSSGADEETRGKRLTVCRLLVREPQLVSPRHFAEGLVPGADGDDGQQAEDERRGSGNVPLPEHDAQVCRVPCE